MDIRRITQGLSVSPQITPEDVAAIAKAGFRAILANRPDDEGADQPDHAALARAAKASGLAFRYLPVTPGAVTDAAVDGFAAALRDLPGPVLAYCRTGTRSVTLWALSEAGRRPSADILNAAHAAGYDLGDLADRIIRCGIAPKDARPAPRPDAAGIVQ